MEAIGTSPLWHRAIAALGTLLAAVMMVAAMAIVSPPPALAASKSCPAGQVRITSNMTSGDWRSHHWRVGSTNYYVEYEGTGWRYTFTGVSYVDNYWYGANGGVPSFYASCVGV